MRHEGFHQGSTIDGKNKILQVARFFQRLVSGGIFFSKVKFSDDINYVSVVDRNFLQNNPLT